MKVILATLGASLLIACGSEPGASATIYVDPPPSGDNSCVGVAGFEVIVSPTGQPQRTKKLVGPATITDATTCAFPESFSISSLPIDETVDVTVNGYDGSGTKVRVTGRTSVPSLRQGPIRLQLARAAPQLPVLLVFDRNPYLGGASTSSLETMTISKQMGGMDLLNVNRTSGDVFLNPEPGAYGMSTPELQNDGSSKGLAINVSFTATGWMIRDARLTVDWNAAGMYYTARP